MRLQFVSHLLQHEASVNYKTSYHSFGRGVGVLQTASDGISTVLFVYAKLVRRF